MSSRLTITKKREIIDHIKSKFGITQPLTIGKVKELLPEVSYPPDLKNVGDLADFYNDSPLFRNAVNSYGTPIQQKQLDIIHSKTPPPKNKLDPLPLPPSEAGGAGSQGPQGIQGGGFNQAQGPTGIQGTQGRQGTQGLQGGGFNQLQGLTGLQGAQGIQGFQGVQGGGFDQAQGATGAVGSQFPQGTQGLQGTQCLQGGGFDQSQGTQGTQGIQGGQGFQGTQGLQGGGFDQSQGTQGPQGVQGAQGVQGRQGTQGLGFIWRNVWSASTIYYYNEVVYYQGNSWIAISDDPAGIPAGEIPGVSVNWQVLTAQGVQGFQGTQGLQGFDGPQGIQGGGFDQSQGTQGLQGVQGVQGQPGPTLGVPPGGLTGEALIKVSAADYDTQWGTISGGGGGSGGGSGANTLIVRLDYDSAGKLTTVTKTGTGDATITGTPTTTLATVDFTFTGWTYPPFSMMCYAWQASTTAQFYLMKSLTGDFTTRSLLSGNVASPTAFTAFDSTTHKVRLNCTKTTTSATSSSGQITHAYIVFLGI